MAEVSFWGLEEYEQALKKLGDNYESIAKKMCRAGLRAIANVLKKPGLPFAQYAKQLTVKRNELGWFGSVVYEGNVKSGTAAAVAARVYESGRRGGVKDRLGRKISRQPARPFLQRGIARAGDSVAKAMQDVYDDECKKLGL